jgi:hypothetical protein
LWDRGKVHTGFCCGDLREGEHLENTGLDGYIILNGSSRTGMDGMDWINL